MSIRKAISDRIKRKKLYKRQVVDLCKVVAHKEGRAFDERSIYDYLNGKQEITTAKLEIIMQVLDLELIEKQFKIK